MAVSARTLPDHILEEEARATIARAKRIDRVFAWCPKCTGPLQQGRCEPCDEEELRDLQLRLEGSIRRHANRDHALRCERCSGSGFVEGFSTLTACYDCGGRGHR